MKKIVLCDSTIRIELVPMETGMLLVFARDGEVQFRFRRSHLLSILDGETIQMSDKGIFCKLSRTDGLIKLVFACNSARGATTFPASELEEMVTALEAPS